MATKDSQQNSESKNSNSSTPEKNKNNLVKPNTLDQKELEEKLVHSHYGLVVSQALYFLDDPNFEDYIQAGLIGLLKAIRNYDKNRSTFSTYAHVCIKNQINKLNKKSIKHAVKNSRNVNEQDKQYNKEEVLDECIPEFLSEENKFIIKLRIQGYTNSEIASFLSCSKSEVKAKIELIIKLLKDYNE
tara:strand:- start:830 stop:1390 length:561 start_codon:yes stop_codon:yes gene_type:complete